MRHAAEFTAATVPLSSIERIPSTAAARMAFARAVTSASATSARFGDARLEPTDLRPQLLQFGLDPNFFGVGGCDIGGCPGAYRLSGEGYTLKSGPLVPQIRQPRVRRCWSPSCFLGVRTR